MNQTQSSDDARPVAGSEVSTRVEGRLVPPSRPALDALRRALPELARNPAVVATAAATAAVGTRLAVQLLERLLTEPPRTPASTRQVAVVHVVHHVVHHVVYGAEQGRGGSAVPPWPITSRWTPR